jgi:hypothetical protein
VRGRRRLGLEPDRSATGVRLGVGEDLEARQAAGGGLDLAVEAGDVAAGLEGRVARVAAPGFPLLDAVGRGLG